MKNAKDLLPLLIAVALVLLLLGIPQLVKFNQSGNESLGAGDRAFTEEQEAEIEGVVAFFAEAMKKTTVDPVQNCPGIREILRAEINKDSVQTLMSIASLLPTDIFDSSRFPRLILEVEEAYGLVDQNCSAKGL